MSPSDTFAYLHRTTYLAVQMSFACACEPMDQFYCSVLFCFVLFCVYTNCPAPIPLCNLHLIPHCMCVLLLCVVCIYLYLLIVC